MIPTLELYESNDSFKKRFLVINNGDITDDKIQSLGLVFIDSLEIDGMYLDITNIPVNKFFVISDIL